MDYRKALHVKVGDPVVIKDNNEIVIVEKAYQADTTNRIFFDCSNGNTYVNRELK